MRGGLVRFLDHARNLVTADDGIRGIRIFPEIDIEIAGADAGRSNANQRLARA